MRGFRFVSEEISKNTAFEDVSMSTNGMTDARKTRGFVCGSSGSFENEPFAIRSYQDPHVAIDRSRTSRIPSPSTAAEFPIRRSGSTSLVRRRQE